MKKIVYNHKKPEDGFKEVTLTKKEKDAHAAEQKKRADEKAAYEASDQYVSDQRRQAYVEAGATIEGVIEALFEMIVEERPEKALAMKIAREEIKARFPKKEG